MKPDPITLDDIIRRIAKVLGITPLDMASKQRAKRIVLARELYVTCAKRTGMWSYPQIAQAVGKHFYGHSTFIEAHKRYLNRMESGEVVARYHGVDSEVQTMTATELVDYILSFSETVAA